MKALWQVTIRKKLQRIKRKHLDESDTEKINLIEEGRKMGIDEVIKRNEIINNILKYQM